MAKIKKIIAREILDSRGNPTVESTVFLEDGTIATSSVPSGASKGTYEALELRDQDQSRFKGMGVLKAVDRVNTIIAPALSGMESNSQKEIDKKMIELDKTQNKSYLGANAILSVSQAVCKASAKASLLPLSVYIRQFLSDRPENNKFPTPLFNVIEGGLHSDSGLNFQEFLVIPASSFDFITSLQIGVDIYKALGEYLRNYNFTTGVGDEGGYSANLTNNLDAMKSIRAAVELTSRSFSKDVFLGLDIASNTIVKNGKYMMKDRSGEIGSEEFINFYKNAITDFSIIYLEDPFAEDDWGAWEILCKDVGANTLIVGDDLTSTNPYRLQMAINNNAINALIIKPNQIGTITETLAVVEMARYKKLKIVVSHRSGETNDDFIADFAVAVNADYVKFGAPVHERIIKYNRLLAIEQELSDLNSL